MLQYFQAQQSEHVTRPRGGNAELHSGLSGQNVAKQKNYGGIKKRKLCHRQGELLKRSVHDSVQCLQIVQSDGFMNITMEDVLFTDALGNKSKFDSFFVQNRLIRSGEKRMQFADEFHNLC